MRALTKLIPVALMLVATVGCGAKKYTYTVPPRIDLTQHEMIGVIEFISSEEGELGPLATRRFEEVARRDQGMVRMIEFGTEEQALRSVEGEILDPATFRMLGTEHNVRTILRGELTISEIKPDLSIAAALRSGTLSANVEATLAVQLIEATTGASLWSKSASAVRTVGQISVFGGEDFVFDAADPDLAYGELVNSLVGQVTRDFHVTYERR